MLLSNNTGSGALLGTFNGVAQGSTVTLDGYNFTARYTGVDGNDFTLTSITTVPEPATWMGGAPGRVKNLAAVPGESGSRAEGFGCF